MERAERRNEVGSASVNRAASEMHELERAAGDGLFGFCVLEVNNGRGGVSSSRGRGWVLLCLNR